MEALGSEAVVVSAVEVSGLRRTRAYVVEQELGGVVKATTFGELMAAVDASVKSLEANELFESASASVGACGGGGAGRAGVKVAVRVSEKQPYALKVGATTSSRCEGEVCWEASGTLRGVLGHGELASASLAQSASQGQELRLGLGAKVAGLGGSGAPRPVDVSFEAGTREAPWAPGTGAARALQVFTTTGRATVGGAWAGEYSRRRGVQDLSASDKFAVAYSAAVDRRDAPQAPTRGTAGDYRLEVAGLGGLGDAAHVKAEAGGQAHWPLCRANDWGPVALSVVGRVGAVCGLPLCLRENIFKDVTDVPPVLVALAPPSNGKSLPLHKPDKFYLGGPLGLRGFDRCGVGARAAPTADPAPAPAPAATGGPAAPQRAPSVLLRAWRDMRGTDASPDLPLPLARVASSDGGDGDDADASLPFAGAAAGGTLFYSAAALLSAPLPANPGASGFKAHVFANCGALLDADLVQSSPNALARDLLKETRASAGVGLSFAPANFARVELNYGWVLRSMPCDLVKRLQFAITGSFGG